MTHRLFVKVQGVLGPTINPLLQPLGLALVAAPNGTVNANPPTCIVEPYQGKGNNHHVPRHL